MKRRTRAVWASQSFATCAGRLDMSVGRLDISVGRLDISVGWTSRSVGWTSRSVALRGDDDADRRAPRSRRHIARNRIPRRAPLVAPLSRRRARMLKKISNAFLPRSSRDAREDDAGFSGNARDRRAIANAASARAPVATTPVATTTVATTTTTPRRASFGDRFMRSWTDEDVTFLGEDPYGDCAGNVFAAVARARDGATADDARDESRRSSVDESSRRASESSTNERVWTTNRGEFEKASAFWIGGPL